MKIDRGIPTLPPADLEDPVIAAYERDIDETLLIENLKLTPAQRGEKFKNFMAFCFQLREAGERANLLSK